ncbi:HDIG domain-containing protein [Paenibacillus urinalis]|uniref:HDIG domain-containing protein n=1 Tax=Paenibacillus urinalis TaxID=521520 RepID=A0AAX3MVC0_9BACL|nr:MULTISPECIES: HDIG domain-containing metalloprotein [Paenibacillus]WDH81573.1 HDIG domain-containing protein [Paenibacillus urinalis]WDH97617.1 HDIG domain-containing protein [Paenibacillus urinalis]WDI01290.1 HDIG domain-containing protein [Paenibacillus urinalis]GAK39642.1 7tm receptor with intracellular metal dependent phosphohydrolase [Paenibacillus sp. TCA20]
MTLKELSKDKSFQNRKLGWKNSRGIRYLLFLFLMILFYVSLAPGLLPERYDIAQGTRSEKEIKAPMQIQDNQARAIAAEEAAEAVQPVYQIVSLRNENLVTSILDRIDRLNQDDISREDKIGIYKDEIPQRLSDSITNYINNNRGTGTYSDALLDEIHRVTQEQSYRIPEETYIKIARLSSEQIQEMKPVARELVSRLMVDQITDASTPRAKVAEMVNTSSLTDRTAREVVQELTRFVITANKFYDEEATKEAKARARENTPQVFIEEGETLVAKGEIITEEVYKLLEDNKLLRDEVNYWPQLGLLLLSFGLSLGIMIYMKQISSPEFKYNNAQLLMLFCIFAITIGCMHIVSFLQNDNRAYVGYLAPVGIGVMLITLLLDIPLAYVCAIIFGILSSIILNTQLNENFDFNFGMFTIIISFAAIFATDKASQRSTLLKSGIIVSLIGSLVVFMLAILGNAEWDRTAAMYSVGFAFAGGILMAVLAIGLMPFFESLFGILSALKLVELSNPNHPLLRKLLTETPGTYHHSVMVGNLSEAAAEAIGADGLLCRVGSYYHDIGKTKRPIYFIENQNNMENPHDTLDPKLSKSIIISHARDGVEMQKDYKLPKRIRDIAEQHHGTTFLHYFYHKALKQAEEAGVEPDFTEEDFRYPGPKAQSKEAAIVGIADSVEAAVRSLRKPTVDQVESMIEKIVKSRLDDHQLNDCDLTMRELDIISRTLKETVMGIFHSRIEYPEEIKKPKES